jgi:hypothetical protein
MLVISSVSALPPSDARFDVTEASDNLWVVMKKFGDTSVPWTVVDSVAVAGYDEPQLKQLLCLK